MFNPFSSRCCQHNHTQGWPYYVENLWMATPDNGLAAVLYAAAEVTAKVGSGSEVRLSTTSNYPFEADINIAVELDTAAAFPMYFRIPSWAKDARAKINGKSVESSLQPGKYLKIYRIWENGDAISLHFPMQLSVTRWDKNHNAASVNYGPLTFSLKIGEQYVQMPSEHTAIHDSKWQEGADREAWPSFAIEPTTPWNYGLVLSDSVGQDFEVVRKAWPQDDFPFTPESTPLSLRAKAMKIPEWTFGPEGLVGELKDSPVRVNTPEEMVELIPMGAARIRITSFPVAGKSGEGKPW